jgi:hypothetical protein
MSKEDKHLWMYSLCMLGNFVLFVTFWKMLFNGNPDILLQANNYGEYWIEFFLLNFIFILQIYMIVKQGIKSWEKNEKIDS